MQLRYQKTLLPASDGIQKVTSIVWSPNNSKMAAVTTDKVVFLFDENGERKDKFKTKPADSGTTNYVVRAMAFSPDSTKLAIAQSDNIVFVYRLGDNWTDKKSICNKFQQSAAVTCLAWPKDRAGEIVFGLADGKVKIGMLKNNKPYNMYSHPDGSYVVSLACNPSGTAVISGHLDGHIYKFSFPAEEGGVTLGHAQVAVHPCVPYALGWGKNSIAAAGNDNKIVFYDLNGKEMQTNDYTNDENVREFTSCAFNPTGDTVTFGTYNRFYVYTYNVTRAAWDEVLHKHVENFYAVSALSWKPDGSKLVVGGLTGAVDVYDACVRRHRYKGKFEFNYVSKSSVIVKTLKSGARIVLKSLYGMEIEKINVYQDRFLIARTADTLLMGDLESCRLSEITWRTDGSEKFHFESERCCLAHYAGELTIVEYGQNQVLGTCRTEHMSPYLISVVVQEARGIAPQSKKLGYLIDLQTVRIVDLITNTTLATVNHDTRIDWLELNQRGTHLLFRDKKRHLHLYDLTKQERMTLLNYCQYVQWVPHSDVVVAQSRSNLCVWYSINTPDRVTMFPIKGEVVDIERNQHRTEVIVDEGVSTVSYALDEALIYFGAALEDQDYERAVNTLEPLELTPETEAHWSQLAELALQTNNVVVAERCYAALGDICRTRFLHRVVKQAAKVAAEVGGDGFESYQVRSQMAVLSQQWPVAESLLLAQGKVDEAIELYKTAYKWEDAIRVADQAHHPDSESLKSAYYKWLLETHQEEKAGLVKEQQGDYLGAIGLYLEGGLPARAAHVVMTYQSSYDPSLVETILDSLTKASLHERAGELLDYLGRRPDALKAFRRGHAYRRAIELARREFPSTVVEIEEEWGDHLMAQKQMDAAINHFIEAGQSIKAIDAAIGCRQFAKAAGIIDFLDPNSALPYYRRIAVSYESLNNLEEAERYYIKADMATEAVEMYSRAGKWEAAQKVARGHLSDSEMKTFYRKKAREFEATNKLKEAEKAYVQGEEYDMAINMYKKVRQYDQMMRLVQQYRKENVAQAHLLVAQQLESEGNLREAEKHYTDAKDWKAAVQMYRGSGSWEDALRVAKIYGGANASKQVAYAWAISLGGDEGSSLLRKMGLLEAAIDYAVESGAFLQAFEFTRAGAKQKLPEVHAKYAMYLEDEGRFPEAEQEFIAASKPREAIDMYCHNQDWTAAMRIAEQYDPTAVSDVLMAQARALAESKQYAPAEQLFLRAKRPEMALKMFRDARLYADALRLAEDYLPSKVQEIQMEMASGAATKGGARSGGGNATGAEVIVNKARVFERNNDYARAIETYLSVTTADTDNHDALEQCWEQAANLAINYQRHRMHDVVNTVSQRLADIQRFQAAAELHEGIDDVQGAIKHYCAGGMYNKARALAGNNPTFNHYIEEQYNAHLVSNANAEELASRGGAQTQQAIDMFVQRDDWAKVHELAAKQGPDVAALYAVRHAERRFKQGDYGEAAAVFAAHGISPNAGYFELYRSIAVGILTANIQDRSVPAENALREMMHKLVTLLSNNPVKKSDLDEFKRLATASHYIGLSNLAKGAGLRDLAARQLASALRSVGTIPADRAFYEAGMAMKEAGRFNMSFVLLNRYLDLTDAMDEPDSSAAVIDNADLALTDIPYDFHIPQQKYVSEDKHEDVRNFVLEISMDQQVEQSLATRACDKCGTPTYEANLTCHNCKQKWEACCVSGYPVLPHDKLVTTSGGQEVTAIREYWNQWVTNFQTCPVTGEPATPMF